MTHRPSKKATILEVAAEHFSRFGYDATHLEAIAKACDISKPAIYYHFRDKAALYETVLLKHFGALAKVIIDNTNSDDPVENLKRYIHTFGTFLVETPCFSAIFAREIADGAESMPESCIVELSKTLNRLASILKSGRKQSVFDCENPFMIQMMIVTTLTSYSTTRRLREKVSSILAETDKKIDPRLEDVTDNLSQKIIKALTC